MDTNVLLRGAWSKEVDLEVGRNGRDVDPVAAGERAIAVSSWRS